MNRCLEKINEYQHDNLTKNTSDKTALQRYMQCRSRALCSDPELLSQQSTSSNFLVAQEKEPPAQPPTALESLALISVYDKDGLFVFDHHASIHAGKIAPY